MIRNKCTEGGGFMCDDKLVRCEQERYDCGCINKQGFCLALNDTKFRHEDGTVKRCPFYKNKYQCWKEAKESSL